MSNDTATIIATSVVSALVLLPIYPSVIRAAKAWWRDMKEAMKS